MGKAIKTFEDAIESFQKDTSSILNYSELLIALGKFDDARKSTEKNINIFSSMKDKKNMQAMKITLVIKIQGTVLCIRKMTGETPVLCLSRDCFPCFCRGGQAYFAPRNDIKTFIYKGFRKNMGTGFTFCLALNVRKKRRLSPY